MNPLKAAWHAFRNPQLIQAPQKYYGGGYNVFDLLSGDSAGTQDRQLMRNAFGASLAYQVVPEVKSALDVIAENMPIIPLMVKDTSGNVIARSDENPEQSKLLMAILDSQKYYGIPLLSLIAYSLKMPGMAFIEIVANDYGYANGFKWLNPHRVNIDAPSGEIRSLHFTDLDGQYRRLLPSQFIMLRDFNPADDVYGYGTTLAIMSKANAVLNFDRMKISYYRNGAQPGILVNFKQPTNLNEAKEYIEVWNSGLRGVDQFFKTHFSSMPADITPLDPIDISKPLEVTLQDSRSILQGYRVPPEMVGDTTDNPYQFSPEKRYNFIQSVIQPILDKALWAFNMKAAALFAQPGHNLYADYAMFEVVTETEKSKQDMHHQDFLNGRSTYNEWRMAGNYAPVAGGDFVMLPRDKMAIPIADIAQVPQISAAANPPPPPALPAVPDTMASVEVEPQKGDVSLAVTLSLANDPDLIALQKRLKEVFPDERVRWIAPADFHVTVLIAPTIEENEIASVTELLHGISAQAFSLRVGSLMCFDNVGEHALHFRIARNSALLDMQASLYEDCQTLGIQTSGHSKPERYIPHITMAYLPEYNQRITYHGKVTVEPSELVCSVERNGEYETAYPVAATVEITPTENPMPATAKSIAIHDGHTIPIDDWDYTPDKAIAELKAWRKFAAGGKKSRPFQPRYLRGDIADIIQSRFDSGANAQDAFDGIVIEHGIECLYPTFEQVITSALTHNEDEFVKSVAEIQNDFEHRFGSVIGNIQSGDVSDRRRAGNILRQMIRTFGYRAFVQGMRDAGVEDEPDEDEQSEISRLVSAQSGFVSDLTAAMTRGDGISDALAGGKARLWFNGSIMPFYNAGLQSANANMMLEFGGDDGEETCKDCQRLKGQRHRIKQWKARNLMIPYVGQPTECKGWNCQHRLIPVNAKARGRF